MGASATRGALIFTAGIGVRPVLSNSLSSSGKPFAESTISFHTGAVTTFTQNSCVLRMFLRVCFSLASGLLAIVSKTMGGMTHTTVKNENGARFVRPAGLIVEAQPIGR